MKISYNRIKNYINIEKSAEELAKILTDIGLEVEGIEQIGVEKEKLNRLKIGKVIAKEKHPNADRLNVTKVDLGNGEPVQIVCGAANVAVGQKVVVAPVNSSIFPIDGSEIKIKKAKLRGELSEGMICAEDEIGIGSSHDGIMVLSEDAPVGKSFADYFKTESDTVFEIGLTPNRVDAASHFGVARDLKAFFHSDKKIQLTKPETLSDLGKFKNEIKIEVKNTDLCPRYSGLQVKNIKVSVSPQWLQKSLKSIGLKPINNIVDITNFVLHELGQPLHAFDAAKIDGEKIIVKTLAKGTPFTTLDEKARKLSANDLMICNATKPMCIAGVFGGLDSGVQGTTTEIFIESAYFNPASIRKTAKFHGLNTDASFRYERGADPEITIFALQRAAALIKQIIPEATFSEISDFYPKKIEENKLVLNLDYVKNILGQAIAAESVFSILNALELKPTFDKSKENIDISVPPYRVDVTRSIDVVEEIVRIYGFNKIDIPPQIKVPLAFNAENRKENLKNNIAILLSNKGFNEILCNSLTSENNLLNENESVEILNPLSKELAFMRQSLIFSGLDVIQYNLNRNNENLSFFEMGKTYFKTGSGKYKENELLSVFMCGNKKTINWNNAAKTVDFFDIKSVLNSIFEKNNTDYELIKSDNALFDFSAEILVGKTKLGTIGKIAGKTLKNKDISQEVFAFYLDLDALLKSTENNKIQCAAVPKFPVVKRDLALLIDKSVQFEQLKATAEKELGNELYEIGLFDDYQGKGIDEDKKSYGLNFAFKKADGTYTDEEIDAIMNRLIARYKSEVNASIR